MKNNNLENINIFDDKNFLAKIKEIEKEIENRNLSYYNDTTTLSGVSLDSKKAKLEIIKLYKPLIELIKSIVKTNFLTLYRAQETKPVFNKNEVNASVLSFTLNKEFAYKWAKNINNSYSRSKAVVVKINVPIENIIGAKANLNQQEFYVENTGLINKIINKILIKYNPDIRYKTGGEIKIKENVFKVKVYLAEHSYKEKTLKETPMWFARVFKMNGKSVDGILTEDDVLEGSDIGAFDSQKKAKDFIHKNGHKLNVILLDYNGDKGELFSNTDIRYKNGGTIKAFSYSIGGL